MNFSPLTPLYVPFGIRRFNLYIQYVLLYIGLIEILDLFFLIFLCLQQIVHMLFYIFDSNLFLYTQLDVLIWAQLLILLKPFLLGLFFSIVSILNSIPFSLRSKAHIGMKALSLKHFYYIIPLRNTYYKARGRELQTSATFRLNQHIKQCKCSCFKHT